MTLSQLTRSAGCAVLAHLPHAWRVQTKKKECNFVFTEYLLAVSFTVGLIG